jgi:hypothetical protein
MAESRLDVVINPSRAQSGARAVKSSIDGLKNSWMEFTAKIFLAEQAATRTWRALSQGAEFEENFARLNRQAGQYNQTSTQLVETIQRTVNGQLSMAEATQVASRAMAQGLNPDQINTFAQAADALGDQMGTDVKSGFDELLQGLRSSRSQALADIGVYVDLQDEMKQLALSTGRTTEQITKQEKAAIAARAIVSQLPDALNKLGDGSISNADKMGAMEKKLEDIAMKSKQAGVGLMFGYMTAMETATQKTQDAFPIFKQWGDWVDEHIFNVPKMELDVSLKGKPGEPPKGPDPKLQLIALEAERDRTMKALEAGESLQGGHFDRMLAQYRNYVVEREKTAVDLAKKEKEVEVGKLQSHMQFIDAQIAEEKRWHDVTIGLADTTEGRITAEEKFKTKVIELLTERAATEEKISSARFDGNYKIRELELRAEEEKGQRITDSLISQFQIGEDLRHRDQDNALAYYQNLAKFQEAYGTTRENQLTTQYDLVRANLAKELDITQETSAKVLNAWRNGDHTRAEELIGNTRLTWEQVTAIMFEHLAKQREVSKQFSDDMLSGFGDGLHRYVNDTSMFGLGVDQARSVAQAMQGAFKQHFFDGLKGEITSIQDVIGGLVDFTQNILADVSSKLVTRMVLGGIDGLMSGGGGGFGSLFGGGRPTNVPWMAEGGITSGPSLAGEAGPEAIVPLPNGRSIPVEWKGGPYGAPDRMVSTHAPAPQVSVPVQIEIRNEVSGADVQAEHRQRPDGSQQIAIVVKDIVRKGFRDGIRSIHEAKLWEPSATRKALIACPLIFRPHTPLGTGELVEVSLTTDDYPGCPGAEILKVWEG